MDPVSNEYNLNDFIGKTTLEVIPNDQFFTKNEDGLFTQASASNYQKLYDTSNGLKLTVTGILRVKDNGSSPFSSGSLSEGLVYTKDLANYVLDNAQKSEIAKAQLIQIKMLF